LKALKAASDKAFRDQDVLLAKVLSICRKNWESHWQSICGRVESVHRRVEWNHFV